MERFLQENTSEKWFCELDLGEEPPRITVTLVIFGNAYAQKT